MDCLLVYPIPVYRFDLLVGHSSVAGLPLNYGGAWSKKGCMDESQHKHPHTAGAEHLAEHLCQLRFALCLLCQHEVDQQQHWLHFVPNWLVEDQSAADVEGVVAPSFALAHGPVDGLEDLHHPPPSPDQ